VVGGGRVLVIAAVLGTTYLGNAFQSSNTVSNLLFELLAAGALSAVLVPTFVGHLDRGEYG
jgi:putative peptidoglycan lipid II flippase